MRTLAIVNLVGAVAAACLATAYMMEWGPFGDPLVRACETELKKRLQSPSGYVRISIDGPNERLLDAGEYDALSREESPAVRKRQIEAIIAGRQVPKMFSASVEYDAPNGFGTPIRSIAKCEYMSAYGELKDSPVLPFLISVDGETSLQYLHRLVKEAS